MTDTDDTSGNKIKHVPEAIFRATAEGICSTLTSPVTIVKGLVHGDLRQAVGGVIDAAEAVEIVGSPATYVGRKAWGETGGKYMGEKIRDVAERNGINIPQTKSDNKCLSEVFAHAENHGGKISLDSIDRKFLRSPQVRASVDGGKPGLF